MTGLTIDLTDIGWSRFFESHFSNNASEGLVPARVVREDRGSYLLLSSSGELDARVSGSFLHSSNSRGDFPAVGDWVACAPVTGEHKAIIHAILPRKGYFKRKVPGERTEEQVVAANVDTVFVVSGLDGGRNFNARRIERYISLCYEGGACPVAVLNKADLCEDIDSYIAQTEAVAIDVPVEVVSAKAGLGIDRLHSYANKGHTLALLGSSGVGKSAIVNAMLGTERQATGAVRPDDLRGRHTTTRREILLLPAGGMLIDTPGMRELQLWGDEDTLSETFSDIEQLAECCRFRDCRHTGEAGCAVEQAVNNGELDPGRYESYLRLQRELAHLARRQDQKTRTNPKAYWKDISKLQRRFKKQRE